MLSIQLGDDSWASTPPSSDGSSGIPDFSAIQQSASNFFSTVVGAGDSAATVAAGGSTNPAIGNCIAAGGSPADCANVGSSANQAFVNSMFPSDSFLGIPKNLIVGAAITGVLAIAAVVAISMSSKNRASSAALGRRRRRYPRWR